MTTQTTCECGQWPIEEYGPRCPSCMTLYWAIPTPYTIGDEFDSLADALTEAGQRIEQARRENVWHGTFVPERVAIDERLKDASGDRPIRRYTLEAKEVDR